MHACRYGISLLVFNLISHSLTYCALTHEISSSTPYLQATCIILFINEHTNDDLFDSFQKIFKDSPKVMSKGQTIISKHFLKISEDCQRFPEITKHIQGRTDVLIIQEHMQVQF